MDNGAATLTLTWTGTIGLGLLGVCRGLYDSWPGTFGRGPLCFGRGPHDMDMAGDRAIWHMVTVSPRI